MSNIYTPQHVANFFLDKAEEECIKLTQLKLMKLIYLAYGWYIVFTHKKLFEEPIQAWKHGPVIESIYHEFKHFRKNVIDINSIIFDLDTGNTIIPRIDDHETIRILEKVWIGYKDFTAISLVNREHRNGTAWYKQYKENENETISDQIIEEDFYQRIVRYINAQRSK